MNLFHPCVNVRNFPRALYEKTGHRVIVTGGSINWGRQIKVIEILRLDSLQQWEIQ